MEESESFVFLVDVAVTLRIIWGLEGWDWTGGEGRSRFGSLRLVSENCMGDLEGDGAGFAVASGRTHVELLATVADSMSTAREGVEFFSGEPCGVGARTVEGERPKGDSGLLNGEARCDVNALEGVPCVDCEV